MVTMIVIGFFLTFVTGIGVFTTAKSAIHEIEGCVLLLMSTVFFSSLGIIHALEKVQTRIGQSALMSRE
jgi:hypothetical protein